MSDTPTHPRPTETLQGRDTGDEYLFYDPQEDVVHVLNGTAREIFLLCDGRRSSSEIAAALAGKYGIDAAAAEKDAADLLDQLRELGLVEY